MLTQMMGGGKNLESDLGEISALFHFNRCFGTAAHAVSPCLLEQLPTPTVVGGHSELCEREDTANTRKHGDMDLTVTISTPEQNYHSKQDA